MAGNKEARVMFFYSDEGVFEKVKRWKTKDRLVQWANDFFKPHQIQLNTLPLPWSESTYKKIFCLKKSNGLKGFSVLDAVDEVITASIESIYETANTLYAMEDTHTSDQEKDYLDSIAMVTKLYQEHNRFLRMQNDQEKDFRLAVQDVVRKNMSLKAIQQPFVHVVFCEFVDHLGKVSPLLNTLTGIDQRIKSIQDVTVAMTLSLEISKLMMFTDKAKKNFYDYIYPIVLIDVNGITKNMNYVLAHEMVHAAGGTKDDKGAKGSIMNYIDAEGKSPGAVLLEPNDLKRLEISFFVK